jgi:hypothetical protein
MVIPAKRDASQGKLGITMASLSKALVVFGPPENTENSTLTNSHHCKLRIEDVPVKKESRGTALLQGLS